MFGKGKLFDPRINPVKVILATLGIVACLVGSIYHGVVDGGPYQPIKYLYAFPWEAGLMLVIGVAFIKAAAALPDYKKEE